jgi:uncharacterized protein (DUF2147 family)
MKLTVTHRPVLKNIAVVFALLCFCCGHSVLAQEKFKANDLVGDWLVAEKTAVITFFQDGHKFYGITSWMGRPKNEDGTPRRDIKNPDPAKRSKVLLGAMLCKDFVYDGDGEWVDGTIYDSRSGKTYNAKITMKDINTISLRGYIGISLFGASTVWTRKAKKS